MDSLPGVLIAIEGIDGAGKTTQVERLCRILIGILPDVVCSKEPTNGPSGKRIRELAPTGRMTPHEELLAFMRDRQEHTASLIRPALQRGAVVVLDRYYLSTIAYQGSRGFDVERLGATMRERFVAPDMAFVLDADPAITLERVRHRGDVPNAFERIESLAAARTVFQRLAGSDPSVRLIDGHQSIAEVHRRILGSLLDGTLKSKFCAKQWGCDELLCAYRVTGECRWARLRQRLGPEAATHS